jgi:hypothetical protein
VKKHLIIWQKEAWNLLILAVNMAINSFHWEVECGQKLLMSAYWSSVMTRDLMISKQLRRYLVKKKNGSTSRIDTMIGCGTMES